VEEEEEKEEAGEGEEEEEEDEEAVGEVAEGRGDFIVDEFCWFNLCSCGVLSSGNSLRIRSPIIEDVAERVE
jgi:hypothetical protein